MITQGKREDLFILGVHGKILGLEQTEGAKI